MSGILVIAMWASCLCGWYAAWMFWKAGMEGKQPKMESVFKCALASLGSLAIGTLSYVCLHGVIL